MIKKYNLKNGTISMLKMFEGKIYNKIKNPDIPIMYLKVNSIRRYAFLNLQQWINISTVLGYDFYIICDNDNLKQKIEKECIFPNGNIKIIKSIRNSQIKKMARKFADDKWQNAAMAHLTTFYHAKKIGVKYFWNIDADDTTFLLTKERTAEILKNAEEILKEQKMYTISLDMWRSYTAGTHWSFGINFVDNQFDWFKNINKFSKGWMDIIRDKYNPTLYNLDWYFSYLLEFQNFNFGTFYVENLHFIHWDEFCSAKNCSNLCHWKDGNIYYPILYKIFKNENFGLRKIAQDCIKINIGIKDEEYSGFYNKFIPNSSNSSLNLGRLEHV